MVSLLEQQTDQITVQSFVEIQGNKKFYERLAVKTECVYIYIYIYIYMAVVLRDVTPCRYIPFTQKAQRPLPEYRNLSA